MRLLHTSDWHLGMPFRSGITYGEDQRFFINQIIEIAVSNKVDGIIIAGDVFDRSIASCDAIEIYDETMKRICVDNKIKVFIVAGNHDGAERISLCNDLLKSSGLYIAGSLLKEAQVFSADNTDIYLLPWITTEKVRSVYPEFEDSISTLEDAYKVVLEDYRSKFVPNHKNILIAHAFITNAETSTSDRAAEVGMATMVSSDVFSGFDYVALGHIHGPQKITDSIRYSGTPMAYSFGKEEKQEKSIVLIDTDTMQIETVPVGSLRGRITLRGTYDELMNGEYSDEILESYIRLEVTDLYVGMNSMSMFREKFKYLLEVSCPSLEKDDASITMTIEEFENLTNSPKKIFEHYFEDVLNKDISSHMMELFDEALNLYEKEAQDL